ncbi:hypothetical protein SEMRO_3811_G351230.1 [Seminavis robusta]|uniref:Uncharacterized protein n=1 Tax=Seminavis robusta TaxID=568900 RepID=A0A9N8F4G6_9STRA|nr:hypothetical protein SEMRO_3811_G351230.1 [Seminavis robusta]|eukprot:Sro3811_g351230.1 n/a (123) ;mRNA; r:2984-3352
MEIQPNKRTRKATDRYQPEVNLLGQRYALEGNTLHGDTISYHFPEHHVYALSVLFDEPISPEIYKASKSDPDTMTLEQAMADTENYDRWDAALEKEIRDLEDHGTWEEVPIGEAQGEVVPVM